MLRLANVIIVNLLLIFAVAQGNGKVFYKSQLIESPNYPNTYPPNVEKEWVFNQTVGKWIVTIKDFNVEESRSCENDYLEIIGKADGVSPERLCGNLPFESHISIGSYLKVKFKSNDKDHHKGFRLQVTHSFDEADLQAKLEQLRKDDAKAAKVKVVQQFEKSDVMYILIIILSVAMVIFFILLGCFIIGICKRKREATQYNNLLVRNMQSQIPFSGGSGRRYSRGKTASFSKQLTRTMPSSIVHQLSPISMNQASPTFSNQASPTFSNQLSPIFNGATTSPFSRQTVFQFPVNDAFVA